MTEETRRLLAGLDGDLASALECNRVELSARPMKLLAMIEGANDGADWHWLVELEPPGGFAYVTGGCDYTGWDCQSNCEAFEAPTLTECLKLVGEQYRTELRDKVIDKLTAESIDVSTYNIHVPDAGCRHLRATDTLPARCYVCGEIVR